MVPEIIAETEKNQGERHNENRRKYETTDFAELKKFL